MLTQQQNSWFCQQLSSYQAHLFGANRPMTAKIIDGKQIAQEIRAELKAQVEKLKSQAFDRETIYYIYVVDSNRTLIGFISLRT